MIPVLIPAYWNHTARARCIASVGDPSDGAMVYTHHNWPGPNLGYTKACNLLLEKADRIHSVPYVVLLNEDAQLQAGTLTQARRFMDAHPRCAIAGFKQLDPLDPDKITHGGTGGAYPGGAHITGSVKNGDCAVSRPSDWVNGAAMIVRLHFVRDCGVMDERLFLYGSDSEWCFRAWASGRWEVWYCAEAVVLHGTLGCSFKPTPEQSEIMDRDMAAWVEIVNGLKMEPVVSE